MLCTFRPHFGPYFRDVGIYFLALCTSIVHDACIYIYLLASFQCDCHDLCHLRLAMPNSHHESKVTSRQILAVEIWHFAQMP